jgi:hypothetical protein
MLNAKTTIMMAKPGNAVTHGAVRANALPAEMRPPHSGAGGGTPKPMKDSPAAAVMVIPSPVVIVTMIGDIAFGKTSEKMIRKLEIPIARAASTNSLFLTESTAALVIRT